MNEQTSEEPSSVDLKWGDKSVSAKSKHMAEVIAALALIVLGVACYGGYLHLQDTRAANAAIVQTLKELSERNAVNDAKLLGAVKEQTCLFVLSETERKADFQSPYGVCKRITQ